VTPHADFDLAVIGGGVNGCGIARDAAGRGARVVLFEKGDLASATSSASTKLIHGGLRYLEFYKFRLVREALSERAVLWRISPHLTHPLRFVLPHHEGLRPRWMLRIGLFLYDHLGARGGLKAAQALDLSKDVTGKPLKSKYKRGFAYSDCQTDDARLVVLNAMDAKARGADIRVRTTVTAAAREGALWRIASRDERGVETIVTARVLVNATGPWVNDTLDLAHTDKPSGVRLVQGSHIVTRKLYDHDRAYIFQNADQRIVFAIPWQGEFTMIGTTDRDWKASPEKIEASPEEIAYLCQAVDDYFERPVTPNDVVWAWSGVRALVDDGASEAREATRDYVLSLDAPEGQAAALSVYGGKITTYRRLAEAALKKLRPHLPAAAKPSWTGKTPLPGGDFPRNGFAVLVGEILERHPFLTPAHAHRLARSYGTRAFALLEGVEGTNDLGEVFCTDLTAREVEYLMDHEWARTAEDVLLRRSKLNLHATAEDAARLEAYMAGRLRAGREAEDGEGIRLMELGQANG
jgi:glycerol-3-phosphate dehydrogenase